MSKKIYLLTLLFIISTFFAFDANSQFRYRTFVKKQTGKPDFKNGTDKKGKQLRNRPFAYRYV